MRMLLCLAVVAFPLAAADWDAEAAQQYLSARQKAWAGWAPANTNGAPCISCHTTLPYLMMRSARREGAASEWERGLVEGVRKRAGLNGPAELLPKSTPGEHTNQLYATQSVLAALVLAADDAPRGKLSIEAKQAFDRMWAIQQADGGWQWTALDLDPWEMPESAYYGTALAALATGLAPEGYQSRPELRDKIAAMKGWLRTKTEGQPLHNRLFALWADAELKGLLGGNERRRLIDETFQKQAADGGWMLESLGPWKVHKAAAPAAAGCSAYATAVAAFTLRRAGVPVDDPRMKKARAWLAAHQDRESGAWAGESMNKVYAADSMPRGFVRDAATAFAVMALQ